jgi:phosphatidylglycerol:prolipoprotein diacylglycerol transferase
MLPYPEIDPVIVRIGPIAVRWYGFMYLAAFGSAYFLVRRQIQEEYAKFAKGNAPSGHQLRTAINRLDGLLLAVALGLVLGARLGYVLFYNLPYYLDHPAEILATWQGGMSFHGGLAGALLAGWFYCRQHQLDFWHWADRFFVTAPLGLGLGRIGNFINGELFGRPSDVPWAMIFPEGGAVPRHPSQLYEAALEGLMLFAILWPLRHWAWPSGRKVALFLILYGVCRILAEFFRQPDPQLGFLLWGCLTMGQVLSAVVCMAGVMVWIFRQETDRRTPSP